VQTAPPERRQSATMNPNPKTKRRRKRRVKEPLTEELLQELLNTSDVRAIADKHCMPKRSLSAYLQQLLDEKGLERADVVRGAGLNETFGYQIFMGQRGASRNKVLQLAFAMGLTLREANRLLQAAGANDLYCKNRRDAIIIFCLDHGYGLQKTDEELYRFSEDTIC
jgi:hypothetical protein